MPNVRRLLAEQGASFDNAFVSLSLCCPSRATFLTGQYAHGSGVLDNRPPGGGYGRLDGENTLPVWLQRAGYATVHLGKYLNGYGRRDPTGIPPGWSEWHGAVDPSTYRYYGYTLNENGRLVRYGTDTASYQTDVYARKAVEIVTRRAASPKPFFLWVAFLAPHAGGPATGHPPGTPLPAPRHRGRFASEALPAPPSFNEADVSDKPAAIQRLPLLGPKEIAAVTESYRLRLESLLAVDEAVAQIVDALSSSGELGETWIIFTSDNGFFHGEHRVQRGKIRLYEPSIRVPLIVRGPGVTAGLRLSQPVSNVDLAPTIVDIAGATAGRAMDGRSLLPLLRDPSLRYGRDLLIEGPGKDAASRSFTALRTPRYKYAEYATGERELYDLARDLYELYSLHADPGYAALRDELARRLTRLRDCAGSSCLAGPALSLSARVRGGCPRALVRATLAGPDAGSVRKVIFFLDGRRVTADRRSPFRVITRLPAAETATLRALALLSDGREVTRDRPVSGCPG